MSVVYLAEQAFPKRKVALKVLAPELAEDASFRDRFIRESNAAASLDHPNVIPIYGAGEEDGVLWIAMRYVEGEDLAHLIGREGALPTDRTTHLVAQVAQALDAAHEVGLIHRDVKPGNVLVGKGDHAYLTDFGLIKRREAGTEFTKTGQFLGSVDYAAPEQIKGESVDLRADLYSLGCVLYECLTGEPPFPRDSEVAVLYAHLNDPPPKVTTKRPELPSAIDDVVATAMAKHPEDRYSSATALAAEAKRSLSPEAEAKRVRPGAPLSSRRPSRLLIAGGVAAAVVAAVLAVLLTRGGTARPNPLHTSSPPSPAGSSVAAPPLFSLIALDPTSGRIVKTVPGVLSGHNHAALSAFGYPMAAGEDGVWVPFYDSGLVHVDERSGTFRKLGFPHEVGFQQQPVAVGFPVVWALSNNPPDEVLRVDPSTDRFLKPVRLPSGNGVAIAVGQGSVWVIGDDGVLTRIDAQTGSIEGRFHIPGSLDLISDGGGAVWITDTVKDEVFQVDPHHPTRPRTILVGGSIDGIAAGEGGLWILDRSAGTVTMIDPSTHRQGNPVRVGSDPVSIAAGLGAVWVTDQTGKSIYRIDPVTLQSTRVSVGVPVAGIALDQGTGKLWVEVVPSS